MTFREGCLLVIGLIVGLAALNAAIEFAADHPLVGVPLGLAGLYCMIRFAIAEYESLADMRSLQRARRDHPSGGQGKGRWE